MTRQREWLVFRMKGKKWKGKRVKSAVQKQLLLGQQPSQETKKTTFGLLKMAPSVLMMAPTIAKVGLCDFRDCLSCCQGGRRWADCGRGTWGVGCGGCPNKYNILFCIYLTLHYLCIRSAAAQQFERVRLRSPCAPLRNPQRTTTVIVPPSAGTYETR